MDNYLLCGWTVKSLKKLETVQTVIDIGVLNGTNGLYKAFPKAYMVLIEPLPQYKMICKEILSHYAGEYHQCAVSDINKEVIFNYDKVKPQCSSLYASPNLNEDKYEQIKIPSYTLDTLFKDKIFQQNILLKIDVEGTEYDIILGGTEFLKKVKYCILEVNIRKRLINKYKFADYITLMAKNNFHLLDIMRVTRKTDYSPEAYIADCLFINTKIGD